MTETNIRAHESLSFDTARAILKSGGADGSLYYDTFMGVSDYPVRWGSETAQQAGYDLTRAQH